eukprot:TRINITY_DN1080_c0_g1_i2.p2 TRINITY_DN1080_c0_g1~~TRINITY_DN1080_c0_g1_i2.p2  ORF type:complete len:226 (+),score=-21.67 TRINITY_DN1080_c0_g1_i2:277-954(+)
MICNITLTNTKNQIKKYKIQAISTFLQNNTYSNYTEAQVSIRLQTRTQASTIEVQHPSSNTHARKHYQVALIQTASSTLHVLKQILQKNSTLSDKIPSFVRLDPSKQLKFLFTLYFYFIFWKILSFFCLYYILKMQIYYVSPVNHIFFILPHFYYINIFQSRSLHYNLHTKLQKFQISCYKYSIITTNFLNYKQPLNYFIFKLSITSTNNCMIFISQQTFYIFLF